MQLHLALSPKPLTAAVRPRSLQRRPPGRAVIQCNTLWQLQPGKTPSVRDGGGGDNGTGAAPAPAAPDCGVTSLNRCLPSADTKWCRENPQLGKGLAQVGHMVDTWPAAAGWPLLPW